MEEDGKLTYSRLQGWEGFGLFGMKTEAESRLGVLPAVSI